MRAFFVCWSFLFVQVVTGYGQQVHDNGKNYPDSSDYWVNDSWMEQVYSGASVCDCQKKNALIMLYLDYTKAQVTIQSSIFHFGLETDVTLDYTTKADGSLWIETQDWPLHSNSITLLEDRSKLYVNYAQQTYTFSKIRLKTLDIPTTPKGIFLHAFDMQEQLSVLATQSLLDYPYTTKTDSTEVFFTFDELKTKIHSGNVSLFCTDDFHYNVMTIRTDSTLDFHLEQGAGHYTIYQFTEERGRHQQVDLSHMKKQVFWRTKPE